MLGAHDRDPDLQHARSREMRDEMRLSFRFLLPFAALLLASAAQAASPSGTTIPSAFKIVDGGGVVWAVAGGISYRNGTADGGSIGLLLYYNGTIYANTTCCGWYSHASGSWASTASDPRGSTIAVDGTLFNYTITLGGNRTLGAPSGLIAGQSLDFLFIQSGTGSRTLGYNPVYKFLGGVAPALTTSAGAQDHMSCKVWTPTNIVCNMISDVK